MAINFSPFNPKAYVLWYSWAKVNLIIPSVNRQSPKNWVMNLRCFLLHFLTLLSLFLNPFKQCINKSRWCLTWGNTSCHANSFHRAEFIQSHSWNMRTSGSLRSKVPWTYGGAKMVSPWPTRFFCFAWRTQAVPNLAKFVSVSRTIEENLLSHSILQRSEENCK